MQIQGEIIVMAIRIIREEKDEILKKKSRDVEIIDEKLKD